METQTAQQVKFSRAGVDITLGEKEIGGRTYFTARADRPTPKGKYAKSKNVFYYRFVTEGERALYVNKYVQQVEGRQKMIDDAKAAKSAAQKAAKNPFKVGDLLYDSWGYDQTNIDFYQVTEVGKMSVVIRRIASKGVPGTQNFMSEDVVPQKDVFLTGDRYGEPLKRIVQVRVWGGVVSYGVRGYYDHGHLSPTTEIEQHYNSWYA